jgi:uncharacterized protein involved in outer membrane biogenesis
MASQSGSIPTAAPAILQVDSLRSGTRRLPENDRVRVLLSILALLAVVGAGLAGFWWLGGPEVHRWMARWALEHVLGRDVRVDGTLDVELGAEPLLTLTGLRIASPPWAEAPTQLQIERAQIRIALRPLLRRVVVLPVVALEGVTIALETAADGRHSWQSDDAQAGPPPTRLAIPLFDRLSVSDATVTYQDRRDGRRTRLHMVSLTHQPDDASGDMRLDAEGDIDGKAFRINGTSGGLETALAATAPYPLELEIQLPSIEARLGGTVADVAHAIGLDLRLEARSPSLLAATKMWNVSVPVDAEVTLNARLVGDLVALSLADVHAEMSGPGGDRIELSGGLGNVWAGGGLEGRVTMTLDPTGPLGEVLLPGWPVPSQIEAAARVAGTVALPVLDEITADIQGPGDSGLRLAGRLGLATTAGIRLESFDLTSTLMVPDPSAFVDRLGFDPSGLGAWRSEAELSLANQRIEVRRLSIDVDDLGMLHVEGNGAIGALGADGALRLEPDFSFAAETTDSGPLLKLIDPMAPELGPVRGSGRLVGGGQGPLMALTAIRLVAGPAEAPSIEASGAIGDVLAFEEVELTGDFEIPAADLLAFAGVDGDFDVGRLQGKVHLSDADGSIGIELLEAEITETDLLALTAEGLIDDLENLDQVRLQTSLEVPSIAKLAEVFGAAGAGLGPFRFDGQLSGGGRRFDAQGGAILGETHFDGVLGGDFGGARPSFEARLHSSRVRLADLGWTPEASRDSIAVDQVTAIARPQLFDSEPLPLQDLRNLDLDLEVQLDSLEGVALAVDRAEAHVTLTDGRLRLSPLRFDVAGGYAEVDAEVDVNAATPKWRLRATTDDLQLGDAWRQLETEVPLGGELALVVDLGASGNSPRDIASSLSGDLSVALQRGQIRSRLFDLTTMNPLRWLVARSTRRGYAKIDCFVARFEADHGVAQLLTLVLDTPNVIAAGEGQIDFARETLDLRFRPSAKQRRLVEFATPFAIRGNLANPVVEASPTGATARALGRVVLSPVNLLGSLLPFVNDRGRDQDNPCLNLAVVDPPMP